MTPETAAPPISSVVSRKGAGEAGPPASGRSGLRFERRFTRPGEDPLDGVTWERRDAVLRNEKGEVIFEQLGVEIPASWSQTATNVVVSKYFRGALETPERESSVRQLLTRVVDRLDAWGRAGGYFASNEDADTFRAEMLYMLLHQMVAFNSPVWFNVGIEDDPQCSACFINSVEDTMPSILDLAKTEGMLFKHGSGTGSNLSSLRSSKEPLAGGGTASGPVSFMRGFDAFAGVIKSGGKTRRAAKMVILNVDHPDILEFIRSKAEEEKKAHALIEAGYDGGFNVPGGAYDSVFFQNANHSVRVSDEFMQAAVKEGDWTTRAVTDGHPMDTYKARDLLREMAQAAWTCGDPGIQFDTTVNAWHTCPVSGRIEASNPCSEYMFLNDTACNLASLNLARFEVEDAFDVEAFRHASEITITAMEIIVDHAGYPTPRITENSRRYRPLGLGYANLGAVLMGRGLPYDSDAGRGFAAAVTALMTGAAYAQSARIAAEMGPFEAFAENRGPALGVLAKHRAALGDIETEAVPENVVLGAHAAWDQAVELGERHGLRNSQISVLAPTGTIGFLMDCDTTGVEPDIALVKYKRLVGGGMIKIVNQTVPRALAHLGYSEDEIEGIIAYIDEQDTIEGAPGLAAEHLAVFDCAFKPAGGERFIQPSGHLGMMAAVQPFLSGAISKTLNLPESSTPDDIMEVFLQAWRQGLKAVAVYRDGCKRSQPVSTRRGGAEAAERRPVRRKLPDERRAITHKFSVGAHEGYITVGLYEDGRPGEIFLTMAKEGSTISGLMDALATCVSISLQYGVPLQTLVDKFSHTRYEPSGFTANPEIPMAKSITDYIFRWLASKFLGPEERAAAGVISRDSDGAEPADGDQLQLPMSTHAPPFLYQQDAPSCSDCGAIMVRNGACYKCLNCGSTSGCS